MSKIAVLARCGGPAELSAQEGIYRRMAELQSRRVAAWINVSIKRSAVIFISHSRFVTYIVQKTHSKDECADNQKSVESQS